MLESGLTVCLHGLTGAPHLNGAAGTCQDFDEDKGRWNVRLANGEVKALKQANLIPAAQASTGCDVFLDGGKVVHVRIGNASRLDALTVEERDTLTSDLAEFSDRKGVRAELRCQEGSRVFSIVLTGEVGDVRAARPELSSMLQFYRLFVGANNEDTEAGEAGKEKRTDPEDGQACTLEDLQSKYAGIYALEEVMDYWHDECAPLPPETEPPKQQGEETLEIDGTAVKSMPARNRRRALDRYGRERPAGYSKDG